MKNAKVNPSTFHNNRQYFNWILYDIGDHFLEKQIDLYKGDLYDLGCGERPYEKFFLQYCEKYIGVDWGKTLHNLKADVIADLNKPLPIVSEKADTIISLSVMEHLQEPQTFLNESYRILKKGGAIILQVPFMWHVHEAPYDFFRYTRFGLQYMFEKAGFVDIHIEAQTGFWTTWFVKLNYQLVRIKYKTLFSKVIFKRMVNKFITLNQNFGFWLDKRWYNSEEETQGYFLIAKKSSEKKKSNHNLNKICPLQKYFDSFQLVDGVIVTAPKKIGHRLRKKIRNYEYENDRQRH